MAQHPTIRTDAPVVENDAAKRPKGPHRKQTVTNGAASACSQSSPQVEVRRRFGTTDTRCPASFEVSGRFTPCGGRRLPDPARSPALFSGQTELIDSGKPPTYVNLARSIGIARLRYGNFARRYPWVEPWSDALLIEQARPLFGAIMRRMGLTALQGGGSSQHADQYLQDVGGFYDRPLPGGERDATVGSAPSMVYNFLVPRPQTPVIPGVTVNEVPQLPANIPTVAVTHG